MLPAARPRFATTEAFVLSGSPASWSPGGPTRAASDPSFIGPYACFSHPNPDSRQRKLSFCRARPPPGSPGGPTRAASDPSPIGAYACFSHPSPDSRQRKLSFCRARPPPGAPAARLGRNHLKITEIKLAPRQRKLFLLPESPQNRGNQTSTPTKEIASAPGITSESRISHKHPDKENCFRSRIHLTIADIKQTPRQRKLLPVPVPPPPGQKARPQGDL